MSYVVHNFHTGDIIQALPINQMDDQIALNAADIEVIKDEQIEQNAGIQNLFADTAQDYSSMATYTVGDFVIYDKKLYRCIVDIAYPELWNVTHWTQTMVSAELKAAGVKIDDTVVSTGSVWSSAKVQNTYGDPADLTTADKTNLVAAINEVKEEAGDADEDIGDLAELDTDAKDNLVDAINEVKAEAEENKDAIGDLTTLETTAKDNLVNAVNELVDEIDDLARENIVAKEYNGAVPYPVDAYVMHERELWKCTTEITTAEAWNPGHWTKVLISDEFGSGSGGADIDDSVIALDKTWSSSKINGITGDPSALETTDKSNLVAALNEVKEEADEAGEDVGDLADLDTTAKSDLVAAINEVKGEADDNKDNIGALSSLTTDAKNNLVAAINEVDAHANENADDIADLETTKATKGEIVDADIKAGANINMTKIGGLTEALEAKQPTLTSGTTIKTINGTSVLGAGDINTSEIDDTSDSGLKTFSTHAINLRLGNNADLTTTVKTNIVAAINEINTSASTFEDRMEAVEELANDTDTHLGDITNLTTTAKTNAVAAINEIDGDVGNVSTLTTIDKSNVVAAINEHDAEIGDLSDLTTDDKDTLVGAINEVDLHADRLFGDTANEYSDASTYNIGDFVLYDWKLYKCTTNITTPETFDASHWNITKIVNEFGSGGSSADFANVIAPDYDDSKTYTIGEYVVNDNKFYKCTTNISSPETWNPAHWTRQNVSDALVASSVEIDDTVTSTTKVWSSKKTSDTIGELASLETTDKTSAVAGINEVNENVGDPGVLTTTAKTNVVAGVNEVNANIGTLSTLTTTAKGSAVAAINELDSDVGDKSTLTTTVKDSTVAAINELDGDIGDLTALTTTTKTSAVAAINELDGEMGDIDDLTTTAKDTVVEAINELDGDIGNTASLTTTVKTNTVAAINEVNTNLGSLAALTTTDKTSTVLAINEVSDRTGALSGLTTTAKTSLVAAINEVDGDVGNCATLTTDAKDDTVSAINELDAEIGDIVLLETDETDDLVAAINSVHEHISDLEDDIAPEYEATSAYNKGAYVRHDGDLYRCTLTHDPEAWTPAHWTNVTVASDMIVVRENIGDVTQLETATKASLTDAVNEVFNQDIVLDKLVATTTTPTIPQTLLPEFVDAILEYDSIVDFPATGQTGRIYVDKATNKAYRWSGTQYSEISPTIALGTTSDTAFRGDKGLEAYTHAVTKKGSEFGIGLYKIATNDEGHVISANIVEGSDLPGIPATKITTGTIQFERLPVGDTATDVCRGDIGTAAYTHAVTKKGIAATEGLYKFASNDQGHISSVTEVTATDIVDMIFDSLYPVGAIYCSATATVIPSVFNGTWVEVKPTVSGNTWNTVGTDGTEIIISYVPGTAAGNVHYWKRTA